MSINYLFLAALAAAGFGLTTTAQAGKTLDAVKARGQVVCGVNTSGPGFSNADSQGNWSGLDVDFCRAIAAAVLKDAGKVKYVPLNSQQRFASLKGFGFGQPRLLRCLIIVFDGLTRHQRDIL